jgi:predicted metal-dependent peptidase
MEDTDRVGILYHELQHIALGHLVKHQGVSAQVHKQHNYAEDLAINSPLIKVCPKHMTLPKETGGSPNGGDGTASTAGTASASQLADILERTLKRAAAQTSHGNIPACVDETFNKLAQYKAKRWHAALRNFYRSSVEGVDRTNTWSRLNRRYGTQSPGTRVGDGKKLIIGIDTSGSMSVEDIQKALGECHAMLKCGVEAKVMFFDTEVHDTKKLTKNMQVTKCGRGGTSFRHFFSQAVKHNPDGVVLFSDMDAPDDISLKDVRKVQVLWVYTAGDREGGLWNSYGKKVLLD